MKTMLLDQSTWDVFLDAAGNWAAADDPYALAQDVSTAIRTWLEDCYYDETLGVTYRDEIFGKNPPLSYIAAQMENAALSARLSTADVYVVKARCVITSFSLVTREVDGTCYFTDNLGNDGSIEL